MILFVVVILCRDLILLTGFELLWGYCVVFHVIYSSFPKWFHNPFPSFSPLYCNRVACHIFWNCVAQQTTFTVNTDFSFEKSCRIVLIVSARLKTLPFLLTHYVISTLHFNTLFIIWPSGKIPSTLPCILFVTLMEVSTEKTDTVSLYRSHNPTIHYQWRFLSQFSSLNCHE